MMRLFAIEQLVGRRPYQLIRRVRFPVNAFFYFAFKIERRNFEEQRGKAIIFNNVRMKRKIC